MQFSHFFIFDMLHIVLHIGIVFRGVSRDSCDSPFFCVMQQFYFNRCLPLHYVDSLWLVLCVPHDRQQTVRTLWATRHRTCRISFRTHID